MNLLLPSRDPFRHQFPCQRAVRLVKKVRVFSLTVLISASEYVGPFSPSWYRVTISRRVSQKQANMALAAVIDDISMETAPGT